MNEDQLLAEFDRLMAEPMDAAEDDVELRELESFAQSIRATKTVRPGSQKVGSR